MQNEIMKILTQAIFSILGVLVTYLTTLIVSYIKSKQQELINKIGIEQYNTNYNIAKSIYFAVEQHFRFIPQAGKEKRELFDKMLLEKIPTLKQADLDHFREAVVGEINSQINDSKIFEAAPVFNPEIDSI